MRILVSGYGDTAGVYDLNERRFVWRAEQPYLSYMCAGAGLLFGAQERGEGGAVFMYAAEGDGFRLTDQHAVPGGLLCHIAYSRRRGLLTGACYGSGDVFALAVKGEHFGETRDYFRQDGEDKAALSRAHCAAFDETETKVYAANIAQDRVYRYDVTGGRLRPDGVLKLPKGAGPRHVLPLGDFLYVITEYSNEVILFRNGQDTPAHTMSALPEGFMGESYCSTLAFLPAERTPKAPSPTNGNACGGGFLYAANRGANTVALFALGANGLPRKLRDFPCGGDWPRHIAPLSDGAARMLAVANERSDAVTVFSLNPADGTVGETVAVIPLKGASFVGML